MQISDLVAFLLYVSIFIRPILRLTALAESYQKGMAGYQRFCQLMDTPSENIDLPGAVDCGTLKGSISFKNVSFGYDPGKPVIQNFDLDIAAGEVIAFVGTTGVGKSTICNLLPLRAVSALSVALYGMFLAIIIPPARKSRVVAALVAISFALSFLCNYLPGISALSEGTRTILLTVLISGTAAVLFPVNPDEQEAEHDA